MGQKEKKTFSFFKKENKIFDLATLLARGFNVTNSWATRAMNKILCRITDQQQRHCNSPVERVCTAADHIWPSSATSAQTQHFKRQPRSWKWAGSQIGISIQEALKCDFHSDKALRDAASSGSVTFAVGSCFSWARMWARKRPAWAHVFTTCYKNVDFQTCKL